jgi:CO/xanthine dehydrogenase FAD-binding subunit
MIIEQLVVPGNISDAYVVYAKNSKAILMAGGVFLRLQKRSIPLVIDLSKLDLDYVREEEAYIRIGSMTNLRTIEQSPQVPDGLKLSVRQIGGVGLRNVATIGGSVCGQYPFSDVATALLALGAKLVFYKAGQVTLESYLEGGYTERDILQELLIPKTTSSSFKSFKSVYTDFSMVNVGVSYEGGWRISVGSRPGGPVLLNVSEPVPNSILAALNTVDFGSDNRASGEYRKALAEALIHDAVLEVSKWK